MVISSARHPERSHGLPALCPVIFPVDAHYSPRAPLPIRWCYHRPGPSRGRSQSELPDLHRSYGLMRQTKILLPTSVSLFRRVFAGCGKSLLEDGPSRRYLCDPCMGAWVRTPPRLNGAFVRFFPLSIGLSLGERGSAPWKKSHNAASCGMCSRGCNHSFIFRLPCLLGPPTALTVRTLSSFGHRAVYTGQDSRRYRSRAPASLRVRTGQLTRQDLQGLTPSLTC